MAKLTKSELLQMELNLERKQNAEKKVEIRQLRYNNRLLENRVKNLEDQIKLKMDSENSKKEIEAFKEELEREKLVCREFNNKLKSKYKIEGGFGINPDTGEIIINE